MEFTPAEVKMMSETIREALAFSRSTDPSKEQFSAWVGSEMPDPEEQRLRDAVVEKSMHWQKLSREATSLEQDGRYSDAEDEALFACQALRDHRAKASAPVAPEPRCEPPVEFRGEQYHWLERGGVCVPAEWYMDAWQICGLHGASDGGTPAEAARGLGWRYVGPCHLHSPASPVTRVEPSQSALADFRDNWSAAHGGHLEFTSYLTDAIAHFNAPARVVPTDAEIEDFRRHMQNADPGSKTYLLAAIYRFSFAPTAAPVPIDNREFPAEIAEKLCELVAPTWGDEFFYPVSLGTGKFQVRVSRDLGLPSPGPSAIAIANELEQAPELLPCPFCGCTCLSDRTTDGRFYYVQCGECGAMSEALATAEDAARAWNRRRPTPEPAPDVRREVSDEEIVALWRETEAGPGYTIRRFARALLAKHSPSISDAQLLKIRDYALTRAPEQFLNDARKVVGR